jgi:hypothetical protein
MSDTRNCTTKLTSVTVGQAEHQQERREDRDGRDDHRHEREERREHEDQDGQRAGGADERLDEHARPLDLTAADSRPYDVSATSTPAAAAARSSTGSSASAVPGSKPVGSGPGRGRTSCARPPPRSARHRCSRGR